MFFEYVNIIISLYFTFLKNSNMSKKIKYLDHDFINTFIFPVYSISGSMIYLIFNLNEKIFNCIKARIIEILYVLWMIDI